MGCTLFLFLKKRKKTNFISLFHLNSKQSKAFKFFTSNTKIKQNSNIKSEQGLPEKRCSGGYRSCGGRFWRLTMVRSEEAGRRTGRVKIREPMHRARLWMVGLMGMGAKDLGCDES
ncbi:unnamed protein product [Vicia faba]|uniref:Uncharacterized protein n=1 Tax=Vicia faba TaxID=3906 RepID=A0AAV0YLX4_VICFA|nr:unnamed protein product [Vicia faba]